MKFDCEVQIGDGPDAKRQPMGSFVKNFSLLQYGILTASAITVVDVTGASISVSAGYSWPQHHLYGNYSNYSQYDNWG